MQTFDNTNNTNQGPQGTDALKTNQNFNAGQRETSGSRFNPNLMHKRSVNLQQQSHQLAKVTEQFAKFAEASAPVGDEVSLRVESMDRNQFGLAISNILVIMRQATRTLIYVVMVEEGNESYTDLNRSKNIQGFGNVNVATTLSDLLDQKASDAIRSYVLSTSDKGAGTDLNNYIIIGHSAIVANPAFEPSDKDLFSVFSNATNGIENFAIEQEPWAIKKFRDNGLQFSSEIDYRPDVVMSPTGIPVRSDARMVASLFEQNVNDPNELPPVSQASQRLFASNVYMDLVPVDPERNPQTGEMKTQRFIPRVVLSNISSGLVYLNMEMIILAVTNMIQLGKNGAWAGMLFPRQSKGVNLRDVGVLSLFDEFGVSKPIDTSTMTTDDYWKMMDELVYRDAAYSIQLDQTHELSWAWNIFRDAASGNPKASAYLANAAANLFGEAFTSRFKPGTAVMNSGNLFPGFTGWYNNDLGEQRPLTELDLCAIANVNSDNLQAISDYLKTVYDLNTPEILRLDMRQNMYKQIFPGVVVKGRTSIGTFSPEFIRALHEASKAVNYAPLLKNAHQQTNARQDVTYNEIRNMAVSGIDYNGTTNYTGGNYTYGYQQPFSL